MKRAPAKMVNPWTENGSSLKRGVRGLKKKVWGRQKKRKREDQGIRPRTEGGKEIEPKTLLGAYCLRSAEGDTGKGVGDTGTNMPGMLPKGVPRGYVVFKNVGTGEEKMMVERKKKKHAKARADLRCSCQ